MRPIVISELLDENDIKELDRIISLKEHIYHEADSGRLLQNLNSLQTSYLNQKITDKVKSILEKNLKMVAEGYTTYSIEYGSPILAPHCDSNETQYILDYHVDSNVEWPIAVEGEYVNLKNNEAVLFSGKYDIHWRPKKEFKDGEFVSMIFFHFVDLDNLEAASFDVYENDENFASRLKKWKSTWEQGN
jgi:hypothetical protein